MLRHPLLPARSTSRRCPCPTGIAERLRRGGPGRCFSGGGVGPRPFGTRGHPARGKSGEALVPWHAAQPALPTRRQWETAGAALGPALMSVLPRWHRAGVALTGERGPEPLAPGLWSNGHVSRPSDRFRRADGAPKRLWRIRFACFTALLAFLPARASCLYGQTPAARWLPPRASSKGTASGHDTRSFSPLRAAVTASVFSTKRGLPRSKRARREPSRGCFPRRSSPRTCVGSVALGERRRSVGRFAPGFRERVVPSSVRPRCCSWRWDGGS